MKLHVLRVPSETKHEGRARRHAAYRGVAPGVVTWHCPTCGGDDHGVPSGAGFSVSTASHDDVAILAIDEPGRRVGVDITPAAPPPEFDHDFPAMWAERESIGKARGVGLLGEPENAEEWHLHVVEFEQFLIAVASDAAIDRLDVITARG